VIRAVRKPVPPIRTRGLTDDAVKRLDPPRATEHAEPGPRTLQLSHDGQPAPRSAIVNQSGHKAPPAATPRGRPDVGSTSKFLSTASSNLVARARRVQTPPPPRLRPRKRHQGLRGRPWAMDAARRRGPPGLAPRARRFHFRPEQPVVQGQPHPRRRASPTRGFAAVQCGAPWAARTPDGQNWGRHASFAVPVGAGHPRPATLYYQTSLQGIHRVPGAMAAPGGNHRRADALRPVGRPRARGGAPGRHGRPRGIRAGCYGPNYCDASTTAPGP